MAKKARTWKDKQCKYNNKKYVFVCPTCKNKFFSFNYIKNRKFCSSKCRKRIVPLKERKFRSKIAKEKGYGKWMVGKKQSQETKNKKSKIMALVMKGKRTSPKSEFKKGKLHWNWKEGITPLIVKIRENKKYRQWRLNIFKRDNFVCQRCGKHNGLGQTVYLEAHHKKEFSKIMRDNNIKTFNSAIKCGELWSINNGVTLCKQCHSKTKKGKYTLDTLST